MLFKSKQKKESLNINLVINNCEIKQVDEIVFLGVTLDEHLSWKHMPESHINIICLYTSYKLSSLQICFVPHSSGDCRV